MVYYIGYIFHNPEAIKALRDIERGLWIDYPGKTSRMELRPVKGALILSISVCNYITEEHDYESADRNVDSIDVTSKVFANRVKADTDELISAIDKLNESKDPALHLKSDPRDGIKLFIES